MKKKQYFGLERNIYFSGLTSFFTDTSVKMVYSIMPLFLLSIGATKTTLSLIEGIAESTSSLLKILSGFWSDKSGRKKPFLIIGYGLTAIITPIYSFAINPLHVLLLRFTERIGKGIRTAPRDSLIGSSIKNKSAGKSFGFHKAMDNSGAIIGPLLSSVLLIFFPLNFKIIFLLATIPAILGVITIIFYIKEPGKNIKGSQSKLSLNKLPKKFYFFLVIVFIFSLGNSTDALLLVKTSETGINQSYIPFIYMIFNSVSVIVAIPAGKLSDKIGRERLILSGYIIYSIVYLLFGAFNHIGIFIFSFILYGFYSAFSDSAQKALVSDITESNVKGSAFGLYHSVIGITTLPASLIAGILYDKVNSSIPFYFGSAMALMASFMLVVFIFYNKKKSRSIDTKDLNN